MEKRSRKVEREKSHSPLVAVSEIKPPPDSVSWRMWERCLDITNLAINTNYMQGMAQGTLDPNDYCSYAVQDYGFCCHAQSICEKIAERALSQGFPEIAMFCKAQYEYSAKSNATLRRIWHLSPEPGTVELGEAARHYVEFKEIVAEETPPIYGLVVMIPCYQLWPYMASKLKDQVMDGNPYRFWFTEYNDWRDAYQLANFINDWVKEHPGQFDESLAFNICRTGMVCELNFFRSACGEELHPIAPLPRRKR